MAFRFLISALALCLSVGSAFAQNTATPVVTGYLSTSGCSSPALTPCFIQYGSGGSGPGSNVVITGPLGQALMAASIPVVIASNQSAVPVTLSGSTSNAGSAVATSSTNVPTVSYNYGFNGTTWDQLQVDGSKNLKTATIGTGTAGSAATGVVTIQGIASMTKLLVTPDSVALPANQSVNISQINGVTTLTGAGATGAGSIRDTVAQDTTTIAGSAPGAAGTASANVLSVQGIASMTPVLVTISPGRTLVTLDVKTVTTGGTAVTALTSGHKSAGGWIQNPNVATVNLCLNEIGTATGTTSSGDTTCIQPGVTYYLAASAGAVSVISSDSSHPFSGYGLQ